MIVVSDTSPLNYLVLIGEVEVLHHLFGSIIVPEAVFNELSHQKAPEAVRKWLSNTPAWLEVRPAPPGASVAELDQGEVEAVALALSLQATVLMDDRKGRDYAEKFGVPVIGTIGVLDRAARMGSVNFAECIKKLALTSFHMSASQVRSLIEKHKGETPP